MLRGMEVGVLRPVRAFCRIWDASSFEVDAHHFRPRATTRPRPAPNRCICGFLPFDVIVDGDCCVGREGLYLGSAVLGEPGGSRHCRRSGFEFEVGRGQVRQAFARNPVPAVTR